MPFLPIVYTACPCCGSAVIGYEFLAKDYVASGETFAVWQCAACTVRFTQAVPPLEAMGRYYDSEDYLSHSTSTQGWFNRVYQQARNYSVWWRFKTIRQHINPEKKRLLDVGTGAGQFAFYMRQKGWVITAVEADEDARKQALQQYGLPVAPPDAMQRMASTSFDVITLWHVLEHVHALPLYLQTVHRLLANEGRLFIAVPNYTAPEARHYGAGWYAYDVPRHLYHFSPAALLGLLGRYGFEPVCRTAFWLDPFYACLQSEKHRGKKAWPLTGAWQGLKSCVAGWKHTEQASAITFVFRKTHYQKK